ncbi:hypothetical protein HMPREF0326_01527 [Desulfovibrio sp. 3_1_syn3]|nr:hypothetical protein HMPREF0326_01527 [Desulfovibrio sp. 3_1_syn3]
MSVKLEIAWMLCALTLALSGCASSAALTNALPPAPATPRAIVTDAWSYTQSGALVAVDGQWVHLPAAEAGDLMLWIEHAESTCR